MKHPTILLLMLFVVSCSNPSQRAEESYRNYYKAEFFYEAGAYGKAKAAAKKVKESSPRYRDAQELIRWIETESVEPEFSEEDYGLPSPY